MTLDPISQLSQYSTSKRADHDPGRPIAELQQFGNNGSMKAILTLTSRGVITLPAKLRRALGLKADDQLIAEATPEGLLLRPAVTLPIEIYSAGRVREFDEGEADLTTYLAKRKRAKRAPR